MSARIVSALSRAFMAESCDGKAIAAPPGEGIDDVLQDSELSLKMDALGVIVLAVDGTMYRIRNWNEMIETERRNAIRLIAKRNAKRKAELLLLRSDPVAAAAAAAAAAAEEEGEADSGATLQIANRAAADREDA